MINRIGEVYGRLTIISFDRKNKNGEYYKCKCSCGNEKIINYYKLKSGHTKSCSCLNKEITIKRNTIHGNSCRKKYTSEYYSYIRMLERCYNPNCKIYKYYGGKGIIVNDRWKGNFINFLQDMNNKPDKSYSIDRIDNNGNYEPGNCKWSTKIEQLNNTSRNRKVINIITNEEYSSIAMAARAINMNQFTLREQLIGKYLNKTNLKLKNE